MAENLVQLLDRSPVTAKAVYWAHNCHIQRNTEADETELGAGTVLAEHYGEAYRAWWLECGQGTYQTRSKVDDRLGTLGTTAVGPAPVGSLPWYLDQAGPDILFLDLRAAEPPEEVTRWQNQSLQVRHEGWAADDPAEAYRDQVLSEACDGIVFVRDVNPARPTSQAVLNAEANRGL